MNAKLAIGAGLVIAAILFLLPSGPEPRGDRVPVLEGTDAPTIEPAALSERILAGGSDVFVLDVRTADETASGTIRGALWVPLSTLDAATIRSLPDDRQLVIYCGGEADARKAWTYIAPTHPRAVVLRNGYPGWTDEVLEPAEPTLEASPEAWEEYRRRRAVADFYLGKTSEASPERPLQVVQPVLRPRPGLGAGEGC